ncbi:hypothetical protein M3649_20135 [Ureibacillus chungkukjangi]|nr:MULTISPECIES: hypothetical protein [Ureibacillus]MCM3390406.1 hypothetical protein [Ureibacillus chungkukjangi]
MRQNRRGVGVYFRVFVIISVILLGACTNIRNVISEDEAKQIVLDNHYSHNGKTEILSVELKNNKYYIEWEIKDNCERGKDSVNKEGKVEIVEAQICSTS